MTNRTTSRTVTFAHAFSLTGVEGVHAPGTYAVEVDEELRHALLLLVREVHDPAHAP